MEIRPKRLIGHLDILHLERDGAVIFADFECALWDGRHPVKARSRGRRVEVVNAFFGARRSLEQSQSEVDERTLVNGAAGVILPHHDAKISRLCAEGHRVARPISALTGKAVTSCYQAFEVVNVRRLLL